MSKYIILNDLLPGQSLEHGADDTSLEDQDHGFASLSDEPKIKTNIS